MPTTERTYGMGRGKVFPASDAQSLLNPLRRLVQSPARLARAMRLSPSDRVLEIGSGPGYFTPHLAAGVPDGVVTAYDLQHEMVAMNAARIAASPGRADVTSCRATRWCCPSATPPSTRS